MQEDAKWPEHGRAFFGRRKGKSLRKGQSYILETLLPRFALDLTYPLSLPTLFPATCQQYILEIGIGSGEHLIYRAQESPHIGFIGCEPFINGMAKTLQEMDRLGLHNIRLHMGDAAKVIAQLPPGGLTCVRLLYPDPWPKARHRKRRFISASMISRLARVLCVGGEFHFATDIDDYTAWTLALFLKHPAFHWHADDATDWLTPFANWPGTRYEAKALKSGRPPVYLRFVRHV